MAPEEVEADEAQDDEEPEETTPLDDEEWLEEAYHGDKIEEGGATQAQIGSSEEVVDYHGDSVTPSTVSHYMKKHGIEGRATSTADERLDDPEWLEDAYHGDLIAEDGASMQQIADECGCSDGTVMRRLHDAGIETRSSAAEAAEPGPLYLTGEVEGVGPATLESIEENGFESDEEVAEADAEDLAEADNLSEESAEDVIAQVSAELEAQGDDESDE